MFKLLVIVCVAGLSLSVPLDSEPSGSDGGGTSAAQG